MNFIIHLFGSIEDLDSRPTIVKTHIASTPRIGEYLLHGNKIYLIRRIIYPLDMSNPIIVADFEEFA